MSCNTYDCFKLVFQCSMLSSILLIIINGCKIIASIPNQNTSPRLSPPGLHFQPYQTQPTPLHPGTSTGNQVAPENHKLHTPSPSKCSYICLYSGFMKFLNSSQSAGLA